MYTSSLPPSPRNSIGTGRLPSELITQVRGLPVRKVLGHFGIQTQQRYAKCPFHEDRRPSASIWENRLHCFRCDRWWDTIDVVQAFTGLDFRSAVRYLCELSGVPMAGAAPALTRRRRRAQAAAEALTARRERAIAVLRLWRNHDWDLARSLEKWFRENRALDWDDWRVPAAISGFLRLERRGDCFDAALEHLEQLGPADLVELFQRFDSQEAA